MFKWIATKLQQIASAITKLVKSANFKKAEDVAKSIGSLLPYAIPVVEMIAALTPGRTDDEIVAVLKKLSVPLSLDTSKPLTDVDKKTALFAAAQVALKGQLVDAIQVTAGVGLDLAGKKVNSIAQIPDSWVDTAVQAAYTFLKAATEA